MDPVNVVMLLTAVYILFVIGVGLRELRKTIKDLEERKRRSAELKEEAERLSLTWWTVHALSRGEEESTICLDPLISERGSPFIIRVPNDENGWEKAQIGKNIQISETQVEASEFPDDLGYYLRVSSVE